MKKVYNLLFIINVLLGMFIFANYFVVYKYTNFSIIMTIIIAIIYLICTLIYNKKKSKKVELIDLIFLSIALISIMIIFVISIVYQLKYNEIFSLLYFNFLIFIPHILILIYNLLR